MSVNVYCLLEIGVTKKALHDPHIYTAFNPSGGKCVTQTMGMEAADTSLIANAVEGTPHIDGVEGAAQLGAEHKVIVLMTRTSTFALTPLVANVYHGVSCIVSFQKSSEGLIVLLAVIFGPLHTFYMVKSLVM